MEQKKLKTLTKYEKLLKQFKYSEALDQCLTKPANPTVVVSMLDELFHRDAILNALSNRTEESLEEIMRFLNKYIHNPKYSRVLIDTFMIILGIDN